MKISQIINEGATDILYHFAPIYAAASILKDGVFKLSNALSNRFEMELTQRDFPYFLSTTRTITSVYHRGQQGVMFVLDGKKINQRYHVKAVNYYSKPRDYYSDNPQNQTNRSTDHAEAEDRIFSKNSTIPIDVIVEMHVYCRRSSDTENPVVRELLLNAKINGIKTYFYDDSDAWQLLNKRKSLPITNRLVNGRLKGKHYQYKDTARQYQAKQDAKKSLKGYAELVFKNDYDDLSDEAKSILNTTSRFNPDEDLRGLLGNRDPRSLEYPMIIKLINYIRRSGFKTTTEFVEWIFEKWKGATLTENIITEVASPVLYHATSMTAALGILKDKVFKLSSLVGNKSEYGFAYRDYPYYLSTARSLTGSFHRMDSDNGDFKVMFVLDGVRIGNNYPVKPINYFGSDSRVKSHRGQGFSEAENRVYSKSNTIPLQYVYEVHVLIPQADLNKNTRTLLMLAKINGIRTYLYKNIQDWLILNKHKAIPVRDFNGKSEIESGTRNMVVDEPQSVLNLYSVLKELIFKKSVEELSVNAKKILHDLNDTGWDKFHEAVTYVGSSTATMRSHEKLYDKWVWLTQYLRKNNMNLSILFTVLENKWKGLIKNNTE